MDEDRSGLLRALAMTGIGSVLSVFHSNDGSFRGTRLEDRNDGLAGKGYVFDAPV